MKKYILPLFFISTICSAFDEQSYQEALSKTQNLLRDSNARQGALDTKEAHEADKLAETTALGDPSAKNQVYNIAADLMPWLVAQTSGDPAKMMQLIMEAQKNPQAFLEKLPESERKKISNLSRFIENKKETRLPANATPSP